MRVYTLFQEKSTPTGIVSEIWNQFRNSNLFKNTPLGCYSDNVVFGWYIGSLFAEAESLPAQMILRVEFVGLLVAGRVAEEIHARPLEVQLKPQAHSERGQVLKGFVRKK